MFRFEVLQQGRGGARVSRLTTPHGVVDCPAFMPVGTKGAIKGVTPAQLAATGTQIMLCNTYHLQLRPGPELVERLGGLQRFTGWERPMLTDSGGYQVFSLAQLAQIDEDGVSFQSHIDGARLRLDPETAMRIQEQLGADIIMAFDECPALPAPRERVREAVERTVRWAQRCRDAHRASERQWLFGIVQGGTDAELRAECAELLTAMGFDGYAVGGLSVGESHEEMVRVLDGLVARLPADRPRYLMGVGQPRDLLAAVQRGIDMFDCVLPTRNGRNAQAFTARGVVRLRNAVHREEEGPIEDGCDCYACGHFSRGYVRHLFLAEEMLGPTLVSLHNLRFFQRFMSRLRELIPAGEWGPMLAEYPIAARDAAPETTPDTQEEPE